MKSSKWKISTLFHHQNPCIARVCEVVELGGVEPPSESVLTQISPGADGYFGQLPKELNPVSLAIAQAVTRLWLGSFIVHGTRKA